MWHNVRQMIEENGDLHREWAEAKCFSIGDKRSICPQQGCDGRVGPSGARQ